MDKKTDVRDILMEINAGGERIWESAWKHRKKQY